MKRLICLLAALACLLTCVSGAAAPVAPREGQVMGQGAPTALPVPQSLPTEDDLTTSAAGLEFIKRHEGFSATPYGDNTQTSIGYGCDTRYAEKYGFSTTYLTEEEAHELMVCVVWELETVLDPFYNSNLIGLNHAQYDALMSFTYNLGTGWTDGCRLSRALIAGGYSVNHLASAWGVWCHVGSQIVQGLVNRRIDEILLFFYDAYTGDETEHRICTLRYTGAGVFDNDIDFYLAGEPYGSFSTVTPLQSGLYFAGWYAGGVRITERTVVTGDLEVTVLWSTEPITEGYEIEALTVRGGDDRPLEQLPETGFYAEATVKRGWNTSDAVVLLAAYTADGRLVEKAYLRAFVSEGTTYSLGAWFSNDGGDIGCVKAFVVSGLSDGTPLCEAAEIR